VRSAWFEIEGDLLDLADVQRVLDALRADGREWKTNAGALGRLGSAALAKGDAAAALACFQQALEIASSRKPASHEATFYRLRRAGALVRLGRHAEAFGDLEHVVGDYAANPSAQIACVGPLLLLAETAATLGDTETARSSCARLLAILSAGASGQSPYRSVETSPLQEAANHAKQLLATLPVPSGGACA
jgi:tetratricopeptide (TPR) repeat protein